MHRCCTFITYSYICVYLHRYIFLEYSAPSHALEAVKNADGYKLDKQHTFRVNLFTDFDKYVVLNCAVIVTAFDAILNSF